MGFSGPGAGTSLLSANIPPIRGDIGCVCHIHITYHVFVHISPDPRAETGYKTVDKISSFDIDF